MSKQTKMLVWWSFFIAVLATIYALIYTMLPFKEPAMWTTYMTVAVLFLCNGDLKKIPCIGVCAFAGYGWGMFCLWICGLTFHLGAYPSLGIGVFISVLACCLAHLVFGAKYSLISSTPMAFITFAVCFAVNGTNAATICLTLLFGLILGALMVISGSWSAKLAGLNKEEENQKA